MLSEKRYCIDCLHCRGASDPSRSRCELFRQPTEIVHLVTGEVPSLHSCHAARVDEDKCGKDGKYWSPYVATAMPWRSSFWSMVKQIKSGAIAGALCVVIMVFIWSVVP